MTTLILTAEQTETLAKAHPSNHALLLLNWAQKAQDIAVKIKALREFDRSERVYVLRDSHARRVAKKTA